MAGHAAFARTMGKMRAALQAMAQYGLSTESGREADQRFHGALLSDGGMDARSMLRETEWPTERSACPGGRPRCARMYRKMRSDQTSHWLIRPATGMSCRESPRSYLGKLGSVSLQPGSLARTKEKVGRPDLGTVNLLLSVYKGSWITRYPNGGFGFSHHRPKLNLCSAKNTCDSGESMTACI